MSALQNGSIAVGSNRVNQSASVGRKLPIRRRRLRIGCCRATPKTYQRCIAIGRSVSAEPLPSRYPVVVGRCTGRKSCNSRSHIHRCEVVLRVFINSSFSQQLSQAFVAIECGKVFHVVAVQLVHRYAHNQSRKGCVGLSLAFQVVLPRTMTERYLFILFLLR